MRFKELLTAEGIKWKPSTEHAPLNLERLSGQIALCRDAEMPDDARKSSAIAVVGLSGRDKIHQEQTSHESPKRLPSKYGQAESPTQDLWELIGSKAT